MGCGVLLVVLRGLSSVLRYCNVVVGWLSVRFRWTVGLAYFFLIVLCFSLCDWVLLFVVVVCVGVWWWWGCRSWVVGGGVGVRGRGMGCFLYEVAAGIAVLFL